MKMTIGEKVHPSGAEPANRADVLRGPGWLAKRTTDGAVVEYQTAGHGTSDDRVTITHAEFEALEADRTKLDEILRRHDV